MFIGKSEAVLMGQNEVNVEQVALMHTAACVGLAAVGVECVVSGFI